MWYHCPACGFEQMYMTRPDRCRGCGRFGMEEGRGATWGRYQLREDVAFDETPPLVAAPVPASLAPNALQVQRTGNVPAIKQIDDFSGGTGKLYQEFIQQHTVYVNEFNNFLLPTQECFAWLNPYIGNAHNRTLFTHLVVSAVAKSMFVTWTRPPRLIEPFVGSGQIFLHAFDHDHLFNGGKPICSEVVGGDLNHYLIAAYKGMSKFGMAFVARYSEFAKAMDADRANYDLVLLQLDQCGKAMATCPSPIANCNAAFRYIYAVNRCQRGTYLNGQGGLAAQFDPDRQANQIRQTELATLGAVVRVLSGAPHEFAHADFAVTCAKAKPSDLVIMDCPFPKFRSDVKATKLSAPSLDTYGVGKDGEALQESIVAATKELVKKGITVIICNYANPELVRAYHGCIDIEEEDKGTDDMDVEGKGLPKRRYTFTYKSPKTNGEAYQLTIVPGLADMTGPINEIVATWKTWHGDDNSSGEPEKQQFFAPARVRMIPVDQMSASERRQELASRQAHQKLDKEDEDYVDDQ